MIHSVLNVLMCNGDLYSELIRIQQIGLNNGLEATIVDDILSKKGKENQLITNKAIYLTLAL